MHRDDNLLLSGTWWRGDFPRLGCDDGHPFANVVAEMKYIVAALYSNYSTSIVDDTGIEQVDSYTAPPASEQLLVKLKKLEA